MALFRAALEAQNEGNIIALREELLRLIAALKR